MEIRAQKRTLRLAETFTISRGSEDEADVVQVEISLDGVTGYGEAAPIERYDESAASALMVLRSSANERARSTPNDRGKRNGNGNVNSNGRQKGSGRPTFDYPQFPVFKWP